MTRHKHAQTGLVTPQLPQLLLTAVLRAFAMLVHYVVSTLQMKQLPPKRDWHTHDDEAALPRMMSDTFKDNHAAQHRSPPALILSSTLRVRPSKDEGVLTTVSHTAPSPSVSHAARAIYLALPCRWRQDQSNEGELPPSVRSTGGGGSPRLRGETEGALSLESAPPSLRVRRFASNPRRKSGPRASRVICVTGLHKQPWIPTSAGTSGFVSPPNKNTAA